MSFHLFAKNTPGTEFQKILNNFIWSSCTATKFSRNTLSHIVFSQKFKLKLISGTFLLPMISRNELSITLSTLWYNAVGTITLHIDTSWQLSSVVYCPAQFSVLSTLYTHSFCVPHPFHILHQLPLVIPGT